MSLFIVTITVVLFWTVWALQVLIMRHFDISWNIASAGQWGDTFGALNALFGSFGIIAVYATLRNQIKANADQRVEIHKQQFESHYFQLLSLLRDLKNNISIQRLNAFALQPVTGQDAINFAHSLLVQSIPTDLIIAKDKKIISDAYTKAVHDKDEAGLGAYFRIIYTILRRISEDAKLEEEERVKYGNLLRGQLASTEIILIGFNGTTPSSKNFSKYIEEFRLLKYTPEGIEKEILKLHYDARTFEERD